ncbi:MAG: hypothetical protein K2N73_08355 [Lachnospiraceae bacterium]|nr:hypothetical protein [Lachnospiraceae bacterium]
MTIDALRRIITEYNILCRFEAEDIVKEIVDRDENFYELQIREKEAAIFYIEKERRSEIHKLCCVERGDGIAWFAALLLSKKELEYNEESIKTLLLPICHQANYKNEDIERIGDFQVNNDYCFVKNDEIPVNLIETRTGYELSVNVNNKCIYKESLESGVNTYKVLVFMLHKYHFLHEVVTKMSLYSIHLMEDRMFLEKYFKLD